VQLLDLAIAQRRGIAAAVLECACRLLYKVLFQA
jgi:hypothetical protein